MSTRLIAALVGDPDGTMLAGDRFIDLDRSLARELAHDKTGQLRVGINLLAGQCQQYGHRFLATSRVGRSIHVTIILSRVPESIGATPPPPFPALRGGKGA